MIPVLFFVCLCGFGISVCACFACASVWVTRAVAAAAGTGALWRGRRDRLCAAKTFPCGRSRKSTLFAVASK